MKPKIKQAIIVEGKYDKIKLESIIDAVIITTEGFEIFSDRQKRELIKTMADKTGIIVLTDSDSAGFIIRNFVCQSIDKTKIKHAFIPDIFGKEKRKKEAGKEGKLGVEGVSRDIILNALKNAGADIDGDPSKSENERKITKLDLYLHGFTGGKNSSHLRRGLLMALNLPEKISSNMLCSIINLLCSYEEFEKLSEKIHNKE